MNKKEEKILDHIVQRMLSDDSMDAPADALTYVKNLYRTRIVEPKPSLVQRILAVMTADLTPGRAVVGERSTGGASRQMLFESGDNAVDLRITTTATGFDIRGQVLGDGFASGEVVIDHAGSPTSTQISAGEFRFTGLAAGDHSMTIRGESLEIFIEQLTLK